MDGDIYMYIDLLKFKAYKLFENSDADLSWLVIAEIDVSDIVINRTKCHVCVLLLFPPPHNGRKCVTYY